VTAAAPEERAGAEALAEMLRVQAGHCERLGSPLYADLLERAAVDVEEGGPTWKALRGHEDDPPGSLPALRLLGTAHRLALQGRAPELAAAYEAGDADAAWPAFRALLEREREELRLGMGRPIQTNEVGRCAALLPGFLAVAAETSLPLRLLEVGTSAGLNLRWDRYRYEAGGFSWGDASSPLRLEFELGGGPLPDPQVTVSERRGCDAAPLDPTTEEGRLTLLAYLWPDQVERRRRLLAALEVVRDVPAEVERASAASWIAAQLREPRADVATVVFHSIVLQYLSEEERADFVGTIAAAGERATADAPLAWLRMEAAGNHADLHLTTWPGGEERHLARVGYHGTPVELLGAD
jgi:hypothetical protein